ncbi:MAG: thioredoxin-dependent thiol peroxidase [Halobacteriaceae archaeon]
MITAGEVAPTFTLPDQDGTEVSLSAFRGQYVVLYFYPEASTRGCTIEARSFRTEWDAFTDLEVPVVGISMDDVEDIAAFAEAESLPFTLLADADGEVARDYGVYAEREIQGESTELALRTTVIVDPDGQVVRVFEDVAPEDHAQEVLEAVEELTGQPTDS